MKEVTLSHTLSLKHVNDHLLRIYIHADCLTLTYIIF